MKHLAQSVVDLLNFKRVDYGDVRVVQIVDEIITVRDGKLENVSRVRNEGIGVRVLVSGVWGFACVSSLSIKDAEEAVNSAIRIASSLKGLGRQVELAKEKSYVDTYVSNFKKNPLKVGLSDKIELLFKVDTALKGRYVKKRLSSLEFREHRQVFANTEGSLIEQTLVDSGAYIRAMAVKDGEVQERSFGNVLRRGFEYIEELDLVSKAQEVSQEAEKLLFAEECPEGEMDLILMPDQMVLQIHESIGHALELDRVLGFEASYAGTSFATVDKLGNYQYGSPLLNVVQDSTIEYGLGTFGYDDEGVKAKKVHLIKEGMLVGYLSSRETAPHIGRESSGAARAQDWSRIPIVRMTNINLIPGPNTLEEMIESTNLGLLLKTNKSWSIDDKRLNFQFGTEVGYLINKGKIEKMVKNPSYTGITPIFWNSLEMVGNEREFELYGLTNCGKGEPGQTMRVGHGSPPCKFKKVKVLPSR